MAPKRHRRMIDGPPFAAVLSLLLLLLLTPRCAHAQPSPPSDSSSDNNYKNYGNLNPTLAIVIVVISSIFLFLVLFSIYICRCNGENDFGWSFRPAGNGASRSRRPQQRGLSPEVLETFPTLMYAEVKELKEGKGALECAVCLSEFEDDEELRLIPRCNHVFHPDCINAWLASHVTCPVCRANLSEAAAADGLDPSAVPTDAAGPQSETAAPAADHVAIVVDRAAEEGEWREEAIELVRIGSRRREARSRSGLRPAKFPRSHSTGHSVVRPVEDVDRYTLRLPEHVRMEIFAARKLHRSASCVAFPNSAEGSSRGVQSARLGKSDRWPSFLFRTLSMKFPAWAGGRRGNGEGSVRKGEGEGSTRGKIASGGGEDGSSAPSLPPQV